MGMPWNCCPLGRFVPSAVEANIVNGAAVKAAVANVCDRLRSRMKTSPWFFPIP